MLKHQYCLMFGLKLNKGGCPRVVVSTAAFHARVRGLLYGLGVLKETQMYIRAFYGLFLFLPGLICVSFSWLLFWVLCGAFSRLLLFLDTVFEAFT